MNIKSIQWGSWLIPRLQDMLFIALFIAVIGLGPRLLNMDGDLGRHLTIGEYILTMHSIPTRDLFSHTMAGEALTPHEWLAQLVFAFAYRLGRLDGVVLFCALLIAVTFTILFRQCVQRSGMVLVGLGFAILAAAAASLHWLARPHLFTLLFLVLWTGELEGLRQGVHHRWWTLPIIMLVWANTHGAFIAGFVVWGIYLVGMLAEIWVRSGIKGILFLENRSIFFLLIGGALALAVTLINPAGWRLWETSLSFLTSRYLVGHTAEYLPPDFQQVSAWPFLLMILFSLLSFGLSIARRSLVAVLLVTAWTGLGLVSARNIPLYALIAAPILASSFANLIRESPKVERVLRFEDRITTVDSNLRGFLWPLLIIGLVILAFSRGNRLDPSGIGNRFSPRVFPVQAVDWMEAEQLSGPGFNYFPWGGYLLFRIWPEQRVFIDGQTDFYGERLTRQYETLFTLGAGWQQILEEYAVRWVLVPEGAQLANALQAEGGWAVRYEDATAVVLVNEP